MKLITKLRKAKTYCHQINGIPTCKNCGIDFDEIIETLEDEESTCICGEPAPKEKIDKEILRDAMAGRELRREVGEMEFDIHFLNNLKKPDYSKEETDAYDNGVYQALYYFKDQQKRAITNYDNKVGV